MYQYVNAIHEKETVTVLQKVQLNVCDIFCSNQLKMRTQKHMSSDQQFIGITINAQKFQRMNTFGKTLNK